MSNPTRQKRSGNANKMTLGLGAIILPLCIYLGLQCGRSVVDDELFTGITNLKNHITQNPIGLFPLNKYSGVYTLTFIGIALIGLLYYWSVEKQREYDINANGTAGWNTNKDEYNKVFNEPFGKKEVYTDRESTNVIIGKDLYIALNKKVRGNPHTLVIGGSGSGKSYSLIKPNILTGGCYNNFSMVITDPKGELLEETGTFLENIGYELKVFNISEMEKSLTYNPYYYIEKPDDVTSMVQCIIDNTRGGDSPSGDPIWEDSMRELLQAVSFYMIARLPLEERNFSNVMDIIRMAEVDEEKSNEKSAFDQLFDDLKKDKDEIKNTVDNPIREIAVHLALTSYKNFRIASGKTLKSILITCLTRLGKFDLPSVKNLTRTDELRLNEVGEKRQALFIIIPASDTTFNFIIATLYSQIFQSVFNRCDNILPHTFQLRKGTNTFFIEKTKEEVERKFNLVKNGNPRIEYNKRVKRYEVKVKDEVLRDFISEKSAEWWLKNIGGEIIRGSRTLPYYTRGLLDEFANIGKINGFANLISLLRSYSFALTVILQDFAQLDSLYDKDKGTIIANCHINIFLGSPNSDVIEWYMKYLGEEEKITQSTTITHGKGGNSESIQKVKSNLMNFNELREMDMNDCIVAIYGQKPFFVKKYNLADHPMFKYSGAGNPDLLYKIPFNNSLYKDDERDEAEMDKIQRQYTTENKEEYLEKLSVNIEDILKDTLGKIANNSFSTDDD